MIKKIEQAMERVMNEYCELEKKSTLEPKDVDNMGKLADIFKDLATAKTMLEYGYSDAGEGYSMAMSMERNQHYPSYTNTPTSMERGRSPMTGRYVSRDDRSSYTESMPIYNGGYSGHSIRDKAIAMLEGSMDSTTSPYEKQELAGIIEQVRNMR